MLNPYTYKLKNKIHIPLYNVNDPGLISLCQNYGVPGIDTIKVYIDLGCRVGYAQLHGNPAGDVYTDVRLMLATNKPLHLISNPLLSQAWQRAHASYRGAKVGIALYTEVRKKLTHQLSALRVDDGVVQLYPALQAINNKPPEVHHLSQIAVDPSNLFLLNRSQKETQLGPSQHELFHKVSSGNHRNKFRVIAPYFIQACYSG
jgi:hypothetical protein